MKRFVAQFDKQALNQIRTKAQIIRSKDILVIFGFGRNFESKGSRSYQASNYKYWVSIGPKDPIQVNRLRVYFFRQNP
jgi:hypothetical protein